MPFVADRCNETSTTTGTGDVTLAGAVTQFQAFATAFAVGSYVSYAIVGQTGSEWEVGEGTLTASTTLRRDRVLQSSNSNALVNFSAGTKNVFSTWSGRQSHKSGVGAIVAHARGWALP